LRLELIAERRARQARLDAGEDPTFVRHPGDWQVAPAPSDLVDRRCEITGPVDRKMMINAFNSGARCFMADFEDANSPTWENVDRGHENVRDAIRGDLALDTPEKSYRLNDETATMLIRPRGWHLVERHVEIDGEPVSASLYDFGRAYANGARYFYLPKLESHLEARLWAEAFRIAGSTEAGSADGEAVDARPEDRPPSSAGGIRCTVLIETILAAFEMEQILWELREFGCALNAGRWDYIFSVIKKFRARGWVLPDRVQVTMTVPFMRAYTDLLVATCHAHGAHAIGGMAAFIPSRKDAEVNRVALTKVREDKEREAGQGFDGTWVAHPDLVPVATDCFARANQLDVMREDVHVTEADLLSIPATPGEVTETGLRTNVSVGIRYLDAWLHGVGAAAIDNLMEDAATAEISRSQVWQWVRAGRFTPEQVRTEAARVDAGDEAKRLFLGLALTDRLEDFLTVSAYDQLD
jgi:malate synthase